MLFLSKSFSKVGSTPKDSLAYCVKLLARLPRCWISTMDPIDKSFAIQTWSFSLKSRKYLPLDAWTNNAILWIFCKELLTWSTYKPKRMRFCCWIVLFRKNLKSYALDCLPFRYANSLYISDYFEPCPYVLPPQPSQNPNIQRQRIRLADMFLDSHEHSDLVVSLLWHRSSSTLLECFLDRYRRDPLSVSQILDIIQESNVSTYKFSLLFMIFSITNIVSDLISSIENKTILFHLGFGVVGGKKGFSELGKMDRFKYRYAWRRIHRSITRVLETKA